MKSTLRVDGLDVFWPSQNNSVNRYLLNGRGVPVLYLVTEATVMKKIVPAITEHTVIDA